MISALLLRLTPVARTVAWPALLAGTLACVAIVAASALAPEWSPLGRWPGLGALALCAGAGFVLDDAAGATVSATPRSLAHRRLQRIALALPLLLAAWAASLWYATSAQGAWFGPDTRLALSVQFASMLTLTLAASAIALGIMPDEHGGWSGALMPVAILTATLLLPERWTLLAAPGDDTWAAAQQRWWALLAIGMLAIVCASRDPAARHRRGSSISASGA